MTTKIKGPLEELHTDSLGGQNCMCRTKDNQRGMRRPTHAPGICKPADIAMIDLLAPVCHRAKHHSERRGVSNISREKTGIDSTGEIRVRYVRLWLGGQIIGTALERIIAHQRV
jgi:hypothetical protein